MAAAEVKLSILDIPAFGEFVERVADFIAEYAGHGRDCASIDADGEWRAGNALCTCGHDDAKAALVPPEAK